MKKHLILLPLIAAMLLPGLAQGQDSCTLTVGPGSPYIEGFEGVTGTAYSTAGVLPTCWTGYSNGTTAAYVPHVTSGGGNYSYYHGGSKSLVMTSGSATYGSTKQAVLPEFSLPLSQLQISFWMCTESSSSGVLSVGYLTDATDTSSFVAVQNFPACAATVHSGNGLQSSGVGATYEVVLNNLPASAQRIAFRWSVSSTSYFSCCIDDVTMEVIPACGRPATLTASNITAVSADLAWTTNTAPANGFRLYYHPTQTPSDIDSTDLLSTAASHQLTQLQANTEYTVKIATICDDYSLSSLRVTTFRTLCVSISRDDMPYTYGFEDAAGSGAANTISPCWHKGTNNTSTAYPYPYSTYKKSGSYSLYFYGSSSYYCYAALPPVEDSVQDLQVIFNLYKSSTSANYGNIQVGVMTDPTNYATFTQVGTTTYCPTAASTWEEFTVNLDSYAGTGLYVAFRVPAASTSYTYLDDVTLRKIPSCFEPTSVTTTEVNASDVTIAWTPDSRSTAAEYMIEYVELDASMATPVTALVTADSVTLHGLTPNTSYRFGVSAVCGAGDTSYAATFEFRTACLPLDTLPYTMDFENEATGSTTSSTFINCWHHINNGTQYFGYPYINGSSSYNHTEGGTKGLYWYAATTTGTYGDYQCVVLPQVDVAVYPINALQLDFWLRASSASYTPTLYVGVMTDPDDINTFEYVDTIQVTTGTVWTEVVSNFANYTGNGRYVAIRFNRGTSASGAYMDDITLMEAPLCPNVNAVNVTSTSTTSASIEWSYIGGASAPEYYDVDLVEMYDSDVVATTSYTTYDMTYMFTSLNAGTQYMVRIRPACSSAYGMPDSIFFKTKSLPCIAIDPSTADTVLFSNSNAGVSGCMAYSSYGNTAYQTIYTAAELTAAGMTAGSIHGIDLGFTGCTTFAKEFSVYMVNSSDTAITSNMLESPVSHTLVYGPAVHPLGTSGWQHYTFNEPFEWDGTSSIKVTTFMNQYGGNQTNSTGLTGYYVAAPNKAAYRYQDNIAFTPATINASAYGGTNYTYRASIHFYMGECTEYASCMAPSAVVDSVQSDAIYVSWAPGYQENTWEVDYRQENGGGWINAESSTSSNTTVISNLNPATRYQVRVGANCGDTIVYATLDVITDCGTLTSLPYTMDFESEATGGSTSRVWVNCWNRLNNGTTYFGYPYVGSSATYNHTANGSKGLYWNASTTTGTYGDYHCVVLPAVDTDNYPIHTLQVKFWAKSSSATTTPVFYVGAMTDPDSIQSFQPIDTITVHGIEWTEYIAELAGFAGSGQYVAIKAVRPSTSWTAYVDDIMLRKAPTCFEPVDVHLAAVSDAEALIAWTDDSRSTVSEYYCEYGPEGFIQGEGNPVSVTGDSILLSVLNANTAYTIYINTVCMNGDSSYTVRFDFRTACTPVAADNLPYREDFEAYGTGSAATIDPCWTKAASGGSPFPYPYSTTPITGTRSLYFYGTATIYSYAAMPMFESDLTALRLRFNAKAYSSLSSTYGSVIEVGVMTDPNDINTFDLIQTIDLSNGASNAVEAVEMNFDSYTGNGRYIAFLSPLTTSYPFTYNYIKVDDVIVDSIPGCRRSTNLVADNVTASSADLSWNNSSIVPVSSYTVAYSTQADFDPATCTTTMIVYDTNATLTGLSDYTDYYWAVKADCDDSAEWSNVASFRTLFDCGLGNVVNINDTIITGASSGYTYTTYAYTTYPKGKTYMIFTAQELGDLGFMSNNVINSISLQSGTTGGTINQLSIYMAETDLAEFSSTPANDTMHMADMQLVYSGDKTFTANSWNEIVLDSAFTYSGLRNLMVLLYRNAPPTANTTFLYGTLPGSAYRTCYGYQSSTGTTISATRAYYRDNIAFNVCTTIPACERPDSVTLVDVQPTTVQFSWQGTAAQYEVAYGARDFDIDTAGTHQVVAANTFTITGLTSLSDYDFYVRSLCTSTGDTSEWAFVYQFSTPCMPQALPYTEDFENYGTGASYGINPCWTKGTNSATQYPYPYATNAISGNRSLYFYSYYPSSATATRYYSYAAMPLMAAAIDSLQVTFSMRRYSTVTDYYTSYLLVGVMSDPADISTFEPVDTIDMKNDPSLAVRGWEVSFQNYTGNGKFIAFYAPIPPLYNTTYQYNYVYLDDIVVDYIPTCPSPVNVTVVDSLVTGSTAVVSWTDRTNPALGYEVEYGFAGFSHGQGTLVQSSTNPVTLTGLQHSSQYDVYVRAICSATDTGAWSFSTSFYTSCEAISSLPVTYDFESYATGTNAAFPQCWTRVHDGTGSYAYYPYFNSSTTYAHSGTKYLYFYGYASTSYPNYQTAVLPEIDTTAVPANTLEVTFWGRGSSSTSTSTTTYYSQVIVGMMSDPSVYSTFVPVDTVNMGTSMAEYSVDFSGYQGNGSYIAFRAMKPAATSTYNYCYIDDITIAQLSPCGRPDSLMAISADATTAQIDWVDTVGATTWVVEYGLNTYGATSQRVVVTTHPYTLTGLSPMSNYWFNVASICPTTLDTGGFATHNAQFFTTQLPAAVPYYCNFEDSTEWANWQTNSNNNINWFRGALGASEGSNGIYISADNGATRSTNMNNVVNAVAYRDIQFDTTPAGYRVTFKVNVGGTTTANYDGVAVVLTDPTLPVSASSTAITSPWGHVNTVGLGTSRHTNGWIETTVNLDNVSGVQRLAFYWFNQSTGTADFEGQPAAIDSVVVELQDCQRPYDVYVDNIGATTAMIHWTGDSQANYTVTYRVQGTATSTNLYQPATGNSALLTGLTPSTSYYVWVRRDCDSNSSSDWSINSAFTTPCVALAASDTIVEDFEGYAASTYNAAGDTPSCWDAYSNGTNSNYMPHVTNSSSYCYPHGGVGALTMTSGAATYGDTKIAVMPLFVEPVSSIKVDFWYKVENTANGTLEVGYVTNSDYASSFVPVRALTSTTTLTQDSVSFENAPENAYRIAFRWTLFGSSSFYSCGLDDVRAISNVTCSAPVITSTTHTYNSMTAQWTGDGSDYEVTIKSASDANFSVEVPVTGNSYTFTGLQPATAYTYRVRQDCSADTLGYSAWTLGTFTTDSMPCLAPTNFQVESVTGTSATFSWTAADASHTAWDIRVYNSAYDSTYTVTTNPATVSGLQAGVTYNAVIRTLCGDAHNIEGEWSDSIPVNPMLCPTVTGLDTTSVDFNQVLLHWNADTLAQSWIVEYGIHGFNQGSGTTATVNVPSYTATGLTDMVTYDFYVRAVCGTNWESENWQSITVTTDQAPAVTYTVTANASNPAYGTVTGGAQYASGSTATLTAIPATGYHFTQWTDGNTSNPRTIIVTSDTTLTADFAANQYTVTVTVNDPAMGTATVNLLSSVTAAYNSTVTLAATANTGYHFVNWSDGDTNATRTLTVTGDTSLMATFAINQYTITAAADDAAMGTVTGAGTYNYGATATLAATANTGYRFQRWNDNNVDNPRTITVTADADYVAYFVADTTAEDTFYTVTLTVNDETMGFVTGAGTVLAGSNVTIEAHANTGYEFVNWSDDNTDAVRTITVNSDITLMATFREVVDSTANLVLSVNDETMGYVTINGAEAALYTGRLGESVSIAAVANSGYRFVEWSDHNTDAERTITLEAATTQLQAVFERNTGIDDVNATLSCTIYPNPAHSTANISVSGVNGQVRIMLLDMSGRVIVNDNVNDNYVLDLQGLAAGTYFVRVVSEETSMVKKLIVR